MLTIGDPTNKIVIAVQRGDSEEAVTTAYADAIQRIARTEPDRLGFGDPGFTRANTAIVERWGPDARDRIKDRAWEIVNGREVSRA